MILNLNQHAADSELTTFLFNSLDVAKKKNEKTSRMGSLGTNDSLKCCNHHKKAMGDLCSLTSPVLRLE